MCELHFSILLKVCLYALIIEDEVVSWHLYRQHVSWCQWFSWICIKGRCFIKVLLLPWLPLRRYDWSMVKIVSRLLHLSKLELVYTVRFYLFQLSKIIERSFSLWLKLNFILLLIAIFKLKLEVWWLNAIQVKI